MSRAVAAVCLTVGVSVAALGALGPGGGSAAGAVPTTTTPTPTIAGAAPASAPAGSGVATTVSPPISTVPRGGAASGSVAKPDDEPWDVRRVVTTTALCMVALSAAGYAYGRVRSTAPRHPDLVRSSE